MREKTEREREREREQTHKKQKCSIRRDETERKG